MNTLRFGNSATSYCLIFVAAALSTGVCGADDTTKSLALFEKRILPLLQSKRPSSCAECHLSGVDLKEYIRPTQTETFAALSAAKLIDREKPDDSKLLAFIARKPDQPSLISERLRQEELAAFREWIRAAVSDPVLLSAKDGEAPIGPQLPAEVIHHARKDRVLASFLENIWSEVGRCAACHSPDRNQEQLKKHGGRISWIQLRDPQATLDHLVAAGLIDVDSPQDSLLLAKPLLQVKHGGGQKMLIGDRSYKQFRRFLDDYAAVAQGKYSSAVQLPRPSDEVSLVTDIWLKLTGVPAEFDKKLLQVDLYRVTDRQPTAYRVATSDRAVFGPQNLWQHSLSLTAPRDSAWAKELSRGVLPPGKYRLKIYVDRTDKLAKDFTAVLDQQDLVGEAEFDSQWPAGYGRMTIVAYPAGK